MRKSINLLHKRKKYKKKEHKFKLIRRIAYTLGVITVLSYGIFFYLQQNVQSEYKELLRKKERHLQEFLPKRELEKQVVYIDKKSILLRDYIEEDANFLPYYEFIKTFLASTAPTASLASLKHDDQLLTQLVLVFPNYGDLYKFMLKLETDETLEHFVRLDIASINISGEPNTRFQVILDGQLTPIEVDT